jgi:hypothetical protein
MEGREGKAYQREGGKERRRRREMVVVAAADGGSRRGRCVKPPSRRLAPLSRRLAPLSGRESFRRYGGGDVIRADLGLERPFRSSFHSELAQNEQQFFVGPGFETG